MYELYDPEHTYILPNGEQGTCERLMRDFAACDTIPYAIRAQDNVLSEMTRLGVLKERYGVSDDDAQTALDAVNAAIAAEKEQAEKERSSVEDIQAQLDALAGIPA